MKYFIIPCFLVTALALIGWLFDVHGPIKANAFKHPEKLAISFHRKAPLSPCAVWWYINYRHAKYPYIVYKQAICESGLSSLIAINNNNILGLRLPTSRPTLALGSSDGYAVYSSWQKCVDDYLILQKSFSGHSEEDYYLFLEHYGDSCYVENLKNAKIPIPTKKLTLK